MGVEVPRSHGITPAGVQLQSRLTEISVELSARAGLAGKDLADAIADEAKQRVPVGSGPTHLRDAIHVTFAGDNDWEVVAGDSEHWYGHIVEHGSVQKGPRPFLVPAAEDQLMTAGARFREKFLNL